MSNADTSSVDNMAARIRKSRLLRDPNALTAISTSNCGKHHAGTTLCRHMRGAQIADAAGYRTSTVLTSGASLCWLHFELCSFSSGRHATGPQPEPESALRSARSRIHRHHSPALFALLHGERQGHVVTTILIGMVAMLFTAISYGRMARAILGRFGIHIRREGDPFRARVRRPVGAC